MLHSERLRRRLFWATDRLKGGRISRHIKDLEESFADPARCRARADSRLKALLKHGAETTAFYRPFRGTTELSEFPVVQKRTIRQRQEEFLSGAYRRSSLVPITTSGSYGTPFTFYLTKDKKDRQRAEVIFFGRWSGYDVGTRHSYFRSGKKPALTLFLQNEVLMRPIYIDAQWLRRQRERLLRDRIRVLVGYTSAIAAVAEYCKAQGDTPEMFSVQGIITSSETLEEKASETMREVFGCRPLSRYSTEEFGVLAQQRPEDGKYVINLASYVVELLAMDSEAPAEPGQPGRVVVTDLDSQAMPLIRYDIGDLAVPSAPAGRDEMPCLERIEGRVVETVYDADGRRMSPFAVNHAMRDAEGVIQFQFIQKAKTEYLVKLVTLEGSCPEEQMRERILELLGPNAHLEIEYVPEIPPLPSGKRPYILSELNRAAGSAEKY